MEGERGITPSIIEELHSWDIQEDQMEGQSVATRSIIDEHHSSDIQRDQTEGESGVNRGIIDETQSWDMIERKVKVVLFEVSLMSLILGNARRSNGR